MTDRCPSIRKLRIDNLNTFYHNLDCTLHTIVASKRLVLELENSFLVWVLNEIKNQVYMHAMLGTRVK